AVLPGRSRSPRTPRIAAVCGIAGPAAVVDPRRCRRNIAGRFAAARRTSAKGWRENTDQDLASRPACLAVVPALGAGRPQLAARSRNVLRARGRSREDWRGQDE